MMHEGSLKLVSALASRRAGPTNLLPRARPVDCKTGLYCMLRFFPPFLEEPFIGCLQPACGEEPKNATSIKGGMLSSFHGLKGFLGHRSLLRERLSPGYRARAHDAEKNHRTSRVNRQGPGASAFFLIFFWFFFFKQPSVEFFLWRQSVVRRRPRAPVSP